MRRREFVTLIGSAAASWPLAGRAQQPAVPLIGFLGPASPVQYAQLLAAFRQGLSETGYVESKVESKNVAIEFRWAELPAALAAKVATTTIPIVFVDGGDPVEDGLVTSVIRPTGNLTGVTVFNSALGAKRLKLLHELVPQVAVIGVLANPSNPNGRRQTKDALEAAQALGLQLRALAASNDQELDGVFAGLEQHVDALMVAVDAFLNSRRERLIALAAAHAVPVIYHDRAFVAGGGLISYGYSIADAYWEAGIYIAKILSGVKPADLPVVQPPKLQLVINLKSAQSLSITVPPSLRARAEAIE